jgi:hypothetical protein
MHRGNNRPRLVPPLLLLLTLAFVLAACARQAEWTAFVYPDKENIPGAGEVQNYTIGRFTSFEACQEASLDRLRFEGARSDEGFQGDYQCGFKCRPREEFNGMLICKTTRK